VQAHILKTDPPFFQAMELGEKKFEIRRNDRDYQVGDILVLAEHVIDHAYKDKSYYTGAVICGRVTYKTTFEQKDEMVVLGIDVESKYRPAQPES